MTCTFLNLFSRAKNFGRNEDLRMCMRRAKPHGGEEMTDGNSRVMMEGTCEMRRAHEGRQTTTRGNMR
jgi:hypothetical protein